MATAEEHKIKTLSAFVAHTTPQHLAKLSAAELKDLHHKVKRALDLHEKDEVAKTPISKMSNDHFEQFAARLMAAKGGGE